MGWVQALFVKNSGPLHGVGGLRTLVVALMAMMWGFASPAAGKECAPFPEPVQFEFKHFIAEPVIDNSKTQAWIQSQPGGNPRTRAQTQSHLQTNINLSFAYKTDPESGQSCTYLTKARFLVAFDELRVFIADNFKPGTCQYQTLHTHELEHVALSRATLERLAPQIERVLSGAVQAVRPVLAADRQQATQTIGKQLNGLLAAQKRLIETQHAKVQREIDTPQSYEALQRLCPTWEQ